MTDINDTGFVRFPTSENIKPLDTGKSFIYLVAIDCGNTKGLSNVNIETSGIYSGEDINQPNGINTSNYESVVKSVISQNVTEIPESFISSILLGWSNFSYYKNGEPWLCKFTNLTDNGQRLYFAMKKLHNDKEIKLLTFNHIK